MTHPFFCCVIRYTAIMPSGGSRKNRRAYRLRWFRLRWWREARALPRQSRALQAWACGSRVAFDAQFGVNDFELRLDGHFSVEKARTWWPNHGKYLDNGRKLILLYVFSPVIGDFPWKSCNFAAKIGLYAKLNYWSQRRNRSVGEVYVFQSLRVHSHLWTQTCRQNIPHTSVFSESICLWHDWHYWRKESGTNDSLRSCAETIWLQRQKTCYMVGRVLCLAWVAGTKVGTRKAMRGVYRRDALSWHSKIRLRSCIGAFLEQLGGMASRDKTDSLRFCHLMDGAEYHWQPRRTARPRDSRNSIETLYAKWDGRVFSILWFPLVTFKCVAYLYGSGWRTLLSQSVQSRWKSGTRNWPPVLLWKWRTTERIQKAVCFSVQKSRTLSCCHQTAGGKAFGDDSRRDTWTVGRQ